MNSVVTIGETMGLFRARTFGPLATSADFSLSVGGAESNVAIGLARLGVSSRWIGRVGDDPIGRRVLRELRAEGVDVRAILDEEATTGIMVRERRIPGAGRVQYYRTGSAGSRLEPRDILPESITDATILHLTGITPALSRTARHATTVAIEIARSAGLLVSFDVNHRSTLWAAEEAAPVYREIARQADIVFAGADEAAILVTAEGDPYDLARRICDLGPSQVVIKLGAEGCVALINGDRFNRPARRIAAIDTVGAGDAFVAGFLAELVEGASAGSQLDTGVSAGAFACLNEGDWEGFPTRAELSLLDAAETVQR